MNKQAFDELLDSAMRKLSVSPSAVPAVAGRPMSVATRQPLPSLGQQTPAYLPPSAASQRNALALQQRMLGTSGPADIFAPVSPRLRTYNKPTAGYGPPGTALPREPRPEPLPPETGPYRSQEPRPEPLPPETGYYIDNPSASREY